MPRIEIVVDELVVHGLPPAQARVAAAALQARLAELAMGRPAGVAPRAEAFVRGSAVAAPAGAPQPLGESVAASVWTELGG